MAIIFVETTTDGTLFLKVPNVDLTFVSTETSTEVTSISTSSDYTYASTETNTNASPTSMATTNILVETDVPISPIIMDNPIVTSSTADGILTKSPETSTGAMALSTAANYEIILIDETNYDILIDDEPSNDMFILSALSTRDMSLVRETTTEAFTLTDKNTVDTFVPTEISPPEIALYVTNSTDSQEVNF